MDKKIESIDKFADYFVICGLDLSSGLELQRSSADANIQDSPLERSYKCKVLYHFPNSVAWNPFDENAVCMFCLPNGLRFKTGNSDNGKPSFHSFVITQQDGKQCYGFSYVFYEKVDKKICNAMHTLQSMYMEELSGGGKRNNNFNANNNTRSLPRHFKISSRSTIGKNYYDVTKDTLYVTRSIALITQFPYVYASYQFLTTFYRFWKGEQCISLEGLVRYLLNDIAVPAPGYSISFSLVPDVPSIVIQSPNVTDELPLFDFPIRQVFYFIDVDSFTDLFTSLMLENQILLCSNDYQQLVLVAETLRCLLFPFVWPHVYVPILPTFLEHFLDAPVPFVMGLAKTDSSLNISSQVCYVDLTTKTIQLPEDLPIIPRRFEFVSEVTNLLQAYNVPICGNFRHVKPSEGSLIRKHQTSKFSTAASSENLDCLEDAPNETSYQLRSSSTKNKKIIKNYGFENAAAPARKDRWYGFYVDKPAYINEQRFNVTIRELFLNKFLHIFYLFDQFVIQSDKDGGDQERIRNFKKASFLSHQQKQHLPFLSQFIETQMFTNFIDNKIENRSIKLQLHTKIFERRLDFLRKRHNEVAYQYCSFEYCSLTKEFENLLINRLFEADVIIPPPEVILQKGIKPRQRAEMFPNPNTKAIIQTTRKEFNRFDEHLNTCDHIGNRKLKINCEAYPVGTGEKLAVAKSIAPEVNSTDIVQKNWDFVDTLLKECRTRVKKMLVSKMSCEVTTESNLCKQRILVEENTFITGLYDLLERIWSHGCENKQVKSPLWNHLLKYKEIDCGTTDFLPLVCATENILDDVTAKKYSKRFTVRSRSASRKSNISVMDEESPTSLVNDMNCVQVIADVNTPVACAKAWIRLCIEKKSLSQHLGTLLSNENILQTLYKRYAFLRCEDEREQFLCHLLTLNAVDYQCFTNTYINAYISYRVVIYTTATDSSSPHLYIAVAGTNGKTKNMFFPKTNDVLHFQNKNLGTLKLLKIGQESSSVNCRCFIDYVTVRNEVTGHLYKFRCDRWLGRDVDDGSLERLLIGKLVINSSGGRNRRMSVDRSQTSDNHNHNRLSQKPQSLVHCDIKQNLSECVNNLLNHLRNPDEDDCTVLLCDENGLVHHLELVLLYGFKSNRFFGRTTHLWDFIAKVKEEKDLVNNGFKSEILEYYFNIINKIQSTLFGKDGRFQMFVCITIRDHTLSHILSEVLARSHFTTEMYEEYSFLRKKPFLDFIIRLLDNIKNSNIVLHSFLTSDITT